jgi:hypothetical protein
MPLVSSGITAAGVFDMKMRGNELRLARRLDSITAASSSQPLSETVGAFRQAEKEALAEQRYVSREIRRAIADRVLVAAAAQRGPLDECAEYFRRCVRLGFCNGIAECQIHIIYARYLIAIDRPEEALHVLGQLHDRGSRRGWERGYAEYKETIERLMDQVRSQRQGKTKVKRNKRRNRK